MSEMDISLLLERLREYGALHDGDKIVPGELDRMEPAFADDWPDVINPVVRNAIVDAGISRPYLHQADAIVKALSGADVVMESPTASGKTLAFVAPMLHMLKQDSTAHAMMIYPMKALAFDQREQLRRVCRPLGIDSWPYDGDSTDNDKGQLRQYPPRILLTNPEYLNMSFLGQREAWDRHEAGARFLRNLRFVVVDEMHEYRGFFGSNMALLLRRFFLYLNRIGASPQIFLSTATCANPQEHAELLTGRRMDLVSARGVLRPKRHFLFVDPEIRDFRYWDILRLRVEQAALAAMVEGLQVLVFCPTKRFLEAAFAQSQRSARERGLNPAQISAFHADLKPDDRQVIQEKIKVGDVRVVFTTNALEIGIDVGGLDGVILAGFPSSIMSAWQQIGRAGRSWDRDAFVLFFAMNDPIDRFFVGNLPEFLNKPFDELVVDPSNAELIGRHLPSLVEETGGQVRPEEESTLGTPFYEAVNQNQGTAPRGYKPQMHLNLRGGIGQSFKLMRHSEEIGQLSAMRRFREAYIGGIFPFFGQRYHVKSHEEQAVVLEDAEQYLRTDPGFYTHLSKKDFIDGLDYGGIQVFYGSINITMNFTGFKMVDERTGEVTRIGGDEEALFLNNLHAFWLDLPQSDEGIAGIGAVEHMIRVGTMFVIPADRFDTSTYSRAAGELTAYCYENYPGGIGVAKKLFSVWDTALKKGMEIAWNCKCTSGCPNCIEPAKSWDISNPNIDKQEGIALAEQILATIATGPKRQFVDGMMMPL